MAQFLVTVTRDGAFFAGGKRYKKGESFIVESNNDLSRGHATNAVHMWAEQTGNRIEGSISDSMFEVTKL
ncbi:MAG: hypothetical protein IKU00_08240 [Bacteroidales bacterium]|nr:hypothetical protein [Bacteroidales bacterium]